MFFIVALALVGIPPLSGFLGKVLIVRGGLSEGHFWLTGLALASSLAVLYSLIKVFMGAFWGESPGIRNRDQSESIGQLMWRLLTNGYGDCPWGGFGVDLFLHLSSRRRIIRSITIH